MPGNTFSGSGTSEELDCTDKKSLTVTEKVQTAADVICLGHAGDIQDVWAWVMRAFHTQWCERRCWTVKAMGIL